MNYFYVILCITASLLHNQIIPMFRLPTIQGQVTKRSSMLAYAKKNQILVDQPLNLKNTKITRTSSEKHFAEAKHAAVEEFNLGKFQHRVRALSYAQTVLLHEKMHPMMKDLQERRAGANLVTFVLGSVGIAGLAAIPFVHYIAGLALCTEVPLAAGVSAAFAFDSHNLYKKEKILQKMLQEIEKQKKIKCDAALTQQLKILKSNSKE